MMEVLKFVSTWNDKELVINREDFVYVKLEDKDNGLTAVSVVYGEPEKEFHIYDFNAEKVARFIDTDHSQDEKLLSAKATSIDMVLRMAGMWAEDRNNQTEISLMMYMARDVDVFSSMAKGFSESM